jgi:hypothetical protein
MNKYSVKVISYGYNSITEKNTQEIKVIKMTANNKKDIKKQINHLNRSTYNKRYFLIKKVKK